MSVLFFISLFPILFIYIVIEHTRRVTKSSLHNGDDDEFNGERFLSFFFFFCFKTILVLNYSIASLISLIYVKLIHFAPPFSFGKFISLTLLAIFGLFT